jgi:AcrR family transcriptional regulator
LPRGRYQQKQWDQREDAILVALETLAAARGFAQVTMDDLADAVGISKATLYQHFERKDDMLIRVIARHAEEFVEWLNSTTDQPPIERLRQTIRYLMENHTMPPLFRMGHDEVLPVFNSSPELIAQHDHMLSLLSDIIRQGQAAHEIAADIAPEVVIRAMWALSSVSRQEAESPERKLPSLDDYADQLITLFERGIRSDQ